MTEKLFTGTLNQNQNKTNTCKLVIHICILSIYNLAVALLCYKKMKNRQFAKRLEVVSNECDFCKKIRFSSAVFIIHTCRFVDSEIIWYKWAWFALAHNGLCALSF